MLYDQKWGKNSLIMIISHQHKLIILLPWKTASQTIRKRLEKFNESPYPILHDWNKYTGTVIHQHLTLYDFLLLPESKLEYQIAVFVRNPYDRVVSGFHQIIKDINTQPRLKFRRDWVHKLVKTQLADNFREVCEAGYDINHWFSQLPAHKMLNRSGDSSLYLYPNHYWTHVNGIKKVNFIGRVENFENDFQSLCATYDLDISSDISKNISNIIAKPNAENYKYLHILNDENKRKINHVFKEDFQLFNYVCYD